MLHYDFLGKGETIVFLHGATVSSTMWQNQVDFFKDKYRVMLIDLPEHGKSTHIKLADFSVEKISIAVIELINKLDIKNFHICGHSLGGMVAQEIAINYPTLVKKLILVETAYGTTNTITEKISTLLAKFVLKIMTQRQLIGLSKKQYGSQSNATKEYIGQEMALYDTKQVNRIMSAALTYASKDRLDQIENETLIIVGFNNNQTHHQAKIMHKLISNSKYIQIADAHHLPNMDNPLEFNKALDNFLT